MKRIVIICLSILGFTACQKDANNPIVKPSNLAYNPSIDTIDQGTTGSSNIPVVNDGGDKIRFSIISAANAGIDINNTTGVISWNSTVPVGVYDIIIAATNLIGASTCSYKLIVNIGSNGTAGFSYTPPNVTVNKGTAGSSGLPFIKGINNTLSYKLTGNIPTGISINPSTGEISWNNALPVGAYNMASTATNGIETISAGFNLNIKDPGFIAIPSGFAYDPAYINVLKGIAGNSTAPSITTGGGNISYSFPNSVPDGITINNNTGVISWNNQVTAGTFAIPVRASNSSGNIITTFTLEVSSFIKAPAGYLYNPSSTTTTFGKAGNSVIPVINDGLGTITYALTGTKPAGISIDQNTGVISWTSSVAAGTYNINCKAANLGGSITTTYTLTVN